MNPILGAGPMEDCKDSDILSITTTVGSEADSRRLARALVETRLAACVQVEGPLRSFYRWEGQLCEEPEWRLVIKTLAGREPALQQFFAEHHPYELPQFLVATLRAGAAYGAWAREEVDPSPTA
jgi:periplasmic divalent cation tolerance protein